MAAEPPDLNPYAPPSTVSDTPLIDAAPIQAPWLRRFIAVQAIVIVASLAVEAYEHESIVGSGPIFSLVGLIIAMLAFRNRDHASMIFGGSAIAFASLIVFLINYNSWGPPQGDRPITILSFIYAAFALPYSAWFVSTRSKAAVNHSSFH
ncbi:hypothetical protein Enr13x_32880 [Stieleria neptunia]|uniref:Uncharacterized protein n=1 Tax=Stieleria neptunia TaxID=2527979 RepID=A0A518HRL3_9BACT|nr:hypothetical protein [Stieleria neptunia]QDV43431.1 hypothetical protein Enr13x_32880 [Stieleria neptunia]